MAAAILTQTVDQKLSLANSLAACEQLVRNSVQNYPLGYSADTIAQLVALQTKLTAALVGNA